MISVLTAVSQKRPNDGVPLEILPEWAETGNKLHNRHCLCWMVSTAKEKDKADKGHGA